MIKPHLEFEQEIWSNDQLAAGVDEVGRGCLAGPVVAAAVVMPKNCDIHQKIRDSKTMTAHSRAEMFEYILENCVDFGIGLVPAADIDDYGINPSVNKAMALAVRMLGSDPGTVLVDAVTINDMNISQKAIIKGDANVYSIAAASIVAKVFRDAIISGIDCDYSDYDFSSHKGYGTQKHIEAIRNFGFTPEHRRTFCTRILSK